MIKVPISQQLPNWPKIVARDQLYHDVRLEIAAYYERRNLEDCFLVDLSILRNAVEGGRVRFGTHESTGPLLDEVELQRAAAEALIDGIVLMFIDEIPVQHPDDRLKVYPTSKASYIRILAQEGF